MRAPTVFLTGILTFCASADPGAAFQDEGAAGAEGYELEASERVRVTPKGGGERSVGHVLRATDDSLVLRITTRVQGSFEPSTRGFAWNEIRDVERSLGREGHLLQGAVLAGAAGLPVFFSDVEFGLLAPWTTAPLGALLGVLHRPERWEALPRTPDVGDRIRVNGTRTGSMAALGPDTLVLETGEAPEARRSVPLETVSRLERSLGSRSYARDGAFYGAILGLGAFYPGVPYGWAGPPLGALLGLGIGALIETERWGPAVVP